MNSITELNKRLENIERNQAVTMKMVRLILQELGIRKELHELDEEVEENNGSSSSAPVGTEGQSEVT